LVWTLVVCALLVLGIKTFVGDIYRVSFSSMEPALRPDELVFVRHDRSTPKRFEPVVVEHQGEYLVKRACGIGGATGETLLIDTAGDLKIDGAYLAPEVLRPEPVLVFVDSLQSVNQYFTSGDAQGTPWDLSREEFLQLKALDVARGSDAGLLRYHKQLTDSYLDSQGHLVEGQFEVHDAVVEFEFLAEEARGVLRVSLVEQGDTFQLQVDLSQPGQARAQLLREGPEQSALLAETSVPFETQAWIRVRLSNSDNHLAVHWELAGGALPNGDPPVIEAGYEFNAVHPLDTQGTGGSFGSRVQLGGEACSLRVRDLRILRDLHWTQRGEFGVGAKVEVPPGFMFLLGDNSAESLDSREFDSLPVERVLGRPRWVVWPPSAIRRL
jgi:hypothetical protein